MAETIIKAKFFRDWVWIWFIFFLVMGIPSLIFSIGWLIYSLIYLKGIVMFMMVFVALSLVILAWSFFFGFLYALNKKIIFSQNYIEYSYPAYSLFGTKKFRVQKKDILAVALGFVAMRKIFPEGMKSKTISMIPIKLFIEIGYIKDGKMLSVQLPKFNNPRYFSEIKKLIRDTKLKKTELAFIFKK